MESTSYTLSSYDHSICCGDSKGPGAEGKWEEGAKGERDVADQPHLVELQAGSSLSAFYKIEIVKKYK